MNPNRGFYIKKCAESVGMEVIEGETKFTIQFMAEIMRKLRAEPEVGHWLLDESDNSIICSACGCYIWANDINDGDAHYCPNCGKKMTGINGVW